MRTEVPSMLEASARLVACSGVVAAASLGCARSIPAVPATDDAGIVAPPLDCAIDGGDWPMYGQNICNTRSSSNTAITAANVSQLAVSWQVTTAGDISATPAVVAGQIYFPDWSGMLYRVDAASHSIVWSRSVSDILGLGGSADGGDDASAEEAGDDAGAGAAGTRSSAVPVARGTPVVSGNLVIFGVDSSPAAMVAVDQATGARVWQTVLDPNPYALIASSPAIDQGVLYVGVSSVEEGAGLTDPNHQYTFRGSVAALDPTTGNVLWQTPMIDDDVYYNPDKSLAGYAGAAVWSGTPTIDRKRGQIYVTTGNNYAVPAPLADGGTLPAGDRLESIVALDLATGKPRWSQRMTTGDIWNFALLANHDYDFGCGANLFQATISGVEHDMVGAGQKSGVYWALDADTGAVLWHTQVGPGGHLGGIHWGTAVDSQRIYVGVNDEVGSAYKLGGTGSQAGMTTSVGSWAALDPATGQILWQIANPTMTAPVNGASVNGPVTVINGVVLVGSMDDDGTMLALNAQTGDKLWSYASGATVYGAPAIVDGVVYWGNGYPQRLFFGTPGNTLFAFSIQP
jgi:polyvinyl alcohol dehydrogenase (cytochrome)